MGKISWHPGKAGYHVSATPFLLIAGLVVLPIVLSVLVALGRLLGAMGDAAGAAVLDRISLGVGIIWLVDLVLLVLVLALERVAPPDGDS